MEISAILTTFNDFFEWNHHGPSKGKVLVGNFCFKGHPTDWVKPRSQIMKHCDFKAPRSEHQKTHGSGGPPRSLGECPGP